MTGYSIAVYFMAAILIDAGYQLHLSLGGDRFGPQELLSTFVFFTAWVPLMPVVVWLAQRFPLVPGKRLRNVEIHFFAALAMAAATLFVHKLVFCPRGCYLGCITYFRAEAWIARWFTLDAFIYSGVVAAIWLSAAIERMQERALRATQIERELASAEFRVMNAQVDPEELIATFHSIAQCVESEPAVAERMIMTVAESLRGKVRAIEETA
jgi:hypothetical protein